MPDWEKLNKELDQALSEMSDEDWKEWKLKRNEKRMKTAVEWYAEKEIQLTLDFIANKINEIEYGIKRIKLFEQAKEIEKYQIINANIGDGLTPEHREKAEQYYSQKFKSE